MNWDSTIGDLYLYESQIEISHYGKEIIERFKENPELPGIILTENNRFITSVSQRKFWEQMSRPYSLELFLKRPIWCLSDSEFLKNDSLILSADASIGEAVRLCLQRPPKLLDEPIAVKLEPQVYRLLDVHQLLVAHAHNYELVTKVVAQLYDRLEMNARELNCSTIESKQEEGHSNKASLALFPKTDRSATLQNLLQFANCYQFEEYLQEKWRQGANEQIWISSIVCHIDFTSDVSKLYNPQSEVKYLQQISAIIKRSIENLGGFAVSYGKSQYAAIIPDLEASEVTSTVEKIRQKIATIKIADRATAIGNYSNASFGVARMIPSHTNSPKTLIAAAEQALEQAKKNGQNYKVIWH